MTLKTTGAAFVGALLLALSLASAAHVQRHLDLERRFGVVGLAELAGGDRLVLPANGADHVVGRQSPHGQLARVQPDAPPISAPTHPTMFVR